MSYKIAIAASEFNQSITTKLLEGAVTRLHEHGISSSDVKIVVVPGAVELPLTVKMLAKTQQYSAIICLGAVIRGETDHYQYVCDQVSQGCQRIMLDYETPVIFGILTTDTEKQALARVGGSEGHKGRDAADTAMRMVTIMEELSGK